jgi:hypothetical protein
MNTTAPRWWFGITCCYCGGIVEWRAGSEGKTALGPPCREVRAVADCTECHAELVIAVEMTARRPATKPTRPEDRYIDGDQAPGAPTAIRPRELVDA